MDYSLKRGTDVLYTYSNYLTTGGKIMIEKDVFDMLVLFVTTKKSSSLLELPPDIQLLFIRKFHSEPQIFKENFPLFRFKGSSFGNQ